MKTACPHCGEEFVRIWNHLANEHWEFVVFDRAARWERAKEILGVK